MRLLVTVSLLCIAQLVQAQQPQPLWLMERADTSGYIILTDTSGIQTYVLKDTSDFPGQVNNITTLADTSSLSPLEGSIAINSTLDSLAIYNGSTWSVVVVGAVGDGSIYLNSGTFPTSRTLTGGAGASMTFNLSDQALSVNSAATGTQRAEWTNIGVSDYARNTFLSDPPSGDFTGQEGPILETHYELNPYTGYALMGTESWKSASDKYLAAIGMSNRTNSTSGTRPYLYDTDSVYVFDVSKYEVVNRYDYFRIYLDSTSGDAIKLYDDTYSLINATPPYANSIQSWNVSGVPSWADGATLGGDGNGIFDATNDGGTVPSDLDIIVTDSILFDTTTLMIDAINNRIGVGTTSLDALLTLGQDNPDIVLVDTDVSHPFTTNFPNANRFFRLGPASGTAGGANIIGISDSDSDAMKFLGYIGSATPTNDAVVFQGWKSDGATSRTALGAGENVATFQSGNNTPLAVFQGDGKVGIGTTSPSVELEVAKIDASPAMILHREDSTPLDGDILGIWGFSGNNDILTKGNYAQLRGISTDVSSGVEEGAITFWTKGAGSISEKMRITGDGNVGIGTTSPVGLLDVTNEAATTTVYMKTFSSGSATDRPVFTGRRARGTEASPLTVNDGDVIFTFLSAANTSSGFVNAAAVEFAVDGTVSAGDVPVDIEFQTGSTGTRTTKMIIKSDGKVAVGTASPATDDKLTVTHSRASSVSNNTGIYVDSDITSGTSGTWSYGIDNDVTVSGTQSGAGGIYGINNSVYRSTGTFAGTELGGEYTSVIVDPTTFTIPTIYGQFIDVDNSGSTTDQIYGLYIESWTGGSSATDTLYGAKLWYQGDAGNSNTKIGLELVKEGDALNSDYGIIQKTNSGGVPMNILQGETAIGAFADPAYTIDVTGDARITALPTTSQTYVVNSTAGGVLGKELASNFTLNGIFDPANDTDTLANLTINVPADSTLLFAVDSGAGTVPNLFKVTYDYSSDDAFNEALRVQGPSDTTIFQNFDNTFQILATDDIRIDAGSSFGVDDLALDADSIVLYDAYTMPTADGSAGEAMVTNGFGVVDWVAVPGFAAYATMRISGGSTTLTSGTDERIDNDTPGTTTAPVNVGGIWTISSSGITYTGTPDIDVMINVSISSSTSSAADMIYELAKEGTVIADTAMERDHGGTDNGSISICYMETLSTNDTLEVYVDCAAGTETVNINNLLMTVEKLD